MSAEALVAAARRLRERTATLEFDLPVTHVYAPLDYAWAVHEQYLRRYGEGPKRVLFLGMNPGPFGMVQTGVPFGEVAAVREWLGLDAPIDRPVREHPQRPIEGWSCRRSEVSGARLWGFFRARFGTAAAFFAEHFVANYCPLAFFAGTRNLTPDKLPSEARASLLSMCDAHLREVVAVLQPRWVIGVGAWAEQRARQALATIESVRIARILHPSPASPAANRGWAEQARAMLIEQGVWA
ncbi:uracil-DNA glycosylase family protein [Tepidiphilus olei]|jgi:single-strand selective monofunctional uracil DNA glycosylase|uniref:Single-strand selective monofunctional uracil DNA glycosylase n=1 Tax=uncultured organism TaxID=155900 RepID=M1PEZ7_9ZZZZ|nr:uracil-DNA glycosylase family protein [Tepidiphilus olei]AGF87238.1 single-strand selective monofunctional uracil DNA glycosylase [uncultured organism]